MQSLKASSSDLILHFHEVGGLSRPNEAKSLERTGSVRPQRQSIYCEKHNTAEVDGHAILCDAIPDDGTK